MGKELPSSWYNAVFSKDSTYDCSAYESPYSGLFNKVVSCLDLNDNIVELGCGTGQLAEMIIDKGFNYIQGVDFSVVAVEKAIRRCGYKFVVCNLNYYEIPECNCIVSTEVFEHIINDLSIISKIKKDTKVVFSVPDFNYRSHVRFFKHEDDVIKRYGHLFRDYTIVKTKAMHTNGNIFVFNGVKK